MGPLLLAAGLFTSSTAVHAAEQASWKDARPPPPPRRLGPLATALQQRLTAISASDSFVFGMQRGNTEGLAPSPFVDCDAARFPNGTVAWGGCDSTSHGRRSDVKAASGSQAGLIAYDYDWAIQTVNWQDLSNASNASRLVIPPHFDY